MKATRIVKKIDSTVLPELEQYKGRKVEIIIISDYDREKEKSNRINKFLGKCPHIGDGMEVQRKIRSEWED